VACHKAASLMVRFMRLSRLFVYAHRWGFGLCESAFDGVESSGERLSESGSGRGFLGKKGPSSSGKSMCLRKMMTRAS
jgi:hypothetical protein